MSKINVQCLEQHVGLVGAQYLLGIRILLIMLAFQYFFPDPKEFSRLTAYR